MYKCIQKEEGRGRDIRNEREGRPVRLVPQPDHRQPDHRQPDHRQPDHRQPD